jgi:hypothetical protein
MVPKIKESLAFRRVAGELFIVDAAASRLHELNGPAALIWESLAAGKSEPRIVSDILAEFEVSEKEARSDLREFVGELSRSGLIL